MVTLYNVNVIDIEHPYIDIDSPFPDKSSNTTDLNYWFFQTMHHEFTHILQQKKNYDTDFNLISAGDPNSCMTRGQYVLTKSSPATSL